MRQLWRPENDNRSPGLLPPKSHTNNDENTMFHPGQEQAHEKACSWSCQMVLPVNVVTKKCEKLPRS